MRRAADYVVSGQYRHPYQLILVNEFQDISQAGAALIRAMLAQNPRCKLFAVGDDWQSINRFAGADIDIMANFAGNFGSASINYLTRTFRSNQGSLRCCRLLRSGQSAAVSQGSSLDR